MTIISTKIAVNLDKNDMQIIENFADFLEHMRCQFIDANIDMGYEDEQFEELQRALSSFFLDHDNIDFFEETSGDKATWENIKL